MQTFEHVFNLTGKFVNGAEEAGQFNSFKWFSNLNNRVFKWLKNMGNVRLALK